MSSTFVGLVLICIGSFAFTVGFVKPGQGVAPWKRWRILIGGPIVLALGILILTGVIGK